MVASKKAVTDGHVCVAYTLARLIKLFEQPRPRSWTTWNLYLIIRQFEPDTSKTHQDKCECYGVPSCGEVERGTIVV